MKIDFNKKELAFIVNIIKNSTVSVKLVELSDLNEVSMSIIKKLNEAIGNDDMKVGEE